MERILPSGFRFTPSPAQLIGHYLARKLCDLPIASNTINDADVYACVPAELDSRFPSLDRFQDCRYFFTWRMPLAATGARVSRKVGSGGVYKGTQSAKDVVDANGRTIGYRQSFAYFDKSGKKTEWLMEEYGIRRQVVDGTKDLVICKIYLTPTARRACDRR
ncbi:NAC domain-containing protein 83-like [Typha angustifolia]|uniref:NAC domain-containing protein 83-like n=1 Tax=Typha angustifolia TaxID=59011 RepID=UPI003C308EC9